MSSSLQLDESALRAIVDEVMRGLGGRAPAASAAPAAASKPAAAPSAPRSVSKGPRYGVFEDVNEACAAAQVAFEQLTEKGIAGRAKVIEIVKEMVTAKAVEWGKFEFEETKIGRLDHKIEKLQIVKLVPGVEWIKPYGLSGDHGITLEEHTPFGVVGAILTIDRKIVEVGRVFRLSGFALTRRILLPAILPAYVIALRSGLGLGWMFVVAAEFMGASEGLEWPEYSQATRDSLAVQLPGFGSASNPTDLTASAIGQEGAYERAVRTILTDPAVDVMIPVLTIASAADIRATARVAADSDKPVPILWTGCASDDPDLTHASLVSQGLAVYRDALSCLKAVRRTMDYAELRRRRAESRPSRPDGTDAQAARQLLGQADGPFSEHRSKALLACYGLPATRERLAGSAAQAADFAQELGSPAVLKVQSPDIPHKTEAGVIRLGLSGRAAVAAAYDEVMLAARTHRPDARIEGVLVQEMVTHAREMLVGVSHDPTFGPVITLGMGGIYVEVLKDAVFRLAPLSPQEARRALGELRAFRLLQGVRGQPAADIDALVDAVVRISWLAVDLGDCIAELDINPLSVLPAGRGVRMVDALVVPRQA